MKISILRSIFLRKGGEGIATRLVAWDADEVKEKIGILLDKDKGEKSFLFYDESETRWVFLTNLRAIVNQREKQFDIWFENVETARLIVRPQKKYWDTFIVKSKLKGDIVIKLESGGPFWGLYNVFRFIGRHNNSLL